MVVTGPDHFEPVQLHSLVFSPRQTRNVLLTLDEALTKHHGWTREERPRIIATPGEFVIYKQGTTHVLYMSDQVYRHLNRPDGTKLLPIEKGGCVVKYFRIKKDVDEA